MLPTLAALLLGVSAAPDPVGALAELADSGARVAGDVAGGAGLAGGAALALGGDALALVDRNRWSEPWLHAVLSGPLHRVALATSWGGTALLESLRAEDIERLPEAQVGYLEAAPFVGRVQSLLDAGGALTLAVHDAATAPVLFAARLAGTRSLAERIRRARVEARIRALGPEPAPSTPLQGRP